MTKAAEEAKRKYEEMHPEAKGMELKNDPLKRLEGNGKRVCDALLVSTEKSGVNNSEYSKYIILHNRSPIWFDNHRKMC